MRSHIVRGSPGKPQGGVGTKLGGNTCGWKPLNSGRGSKCRTYNLRDYDRTSRRNCDLTFFILKLLYVYHIVKLLVKIIQGIRLS